MRGLVDLRLARLICRRELGAAFDTPVAWASLVASVLLVNTAFMNGFFLGGRLEMTSFFASMPLFLAVLLPALSMRLFAEERKQRTIELLFSLPIRARDAVLGKFLAAACLFGLFLVGTLPIPLLLAYLGSPDVGAILAGYLGLGLLGAELLALGLFASALTSDQLVAFVAAAVPGAALVLLGDPRVTSVLDGLGDDPGRALGSDLAALLSPTPAFETFVGGVVALESLVHLVAFTAFFLWAATRVVDRGRA
ncbi:MAG: ABC transporter permease [Planctomycetota bacterium]|nr:ABC transporter permease [Planctomycetota bacterium]